jgi:hypothetical protein
MYCVFLGKAVGTVNAPAGSINNSQISYPLAQSGAVVSSFNRTSSDGNILELQKDGTVVGSIGNKAANIFMTNNSSNNTGFKINPDAITPSTSTGTDRDNAIDLGASGAAYKDLYLGGGLLVGGTGTANKLDDYEEGTFTPAYNAGTSGGSYSYQVGEYTKIGNLCFFQIQIQGSGMSATTSQLSISGLPFSSDSGSPYGGATININFNFRSDGDITSHVPSNSTLLYFYQNNGTSFLGTEATNINAGLLLHGYYRTA